MSKARYPPRDISNTYLSELSLSTYRSLDDCINILLLKLNQSQIEYATLIVHDKDSAETHVHIYIRLPRARLVSQVIRWFRGVDSEGILINTFAQPVRTGYRELINYFLHRSNPEKYQYSEDELVYIGNAQECDSESFDDSYTILQKLCSGVPLMDLVREYGKDFVYHYRSYKELMGDIISLETKIYTKNKKE